MMRAPRDPRLRPLRVSLAQLSSAIVIAAALSAASRGATLTWDRDAMGGNNAASGAGIGGSGTWDHLTASNWWSGRSAVTSWNNAGLDTAVFAGATGTVNLGMPITAGNLVFNTSDYVLTGSDLTLGANAIVNLHDRTGAAVNATITSRLAGNGITLNGNGGTLTLNYAGATPLATGEIKIRSGTLQMKSTQTALRATTPITFAGSGVLLVDNSGAVGATTSQLGALRSAGGDGVVNVKRTEAQNVQLTFGSLTRAAGATGLFQANGNFGAGNLASLSTNARISVVGVGTGFMPGYFAKSEGGFAGFAFNDAGGFVRELVYDGGDPDALTISGMAAQFPTDAHLRVTSTLGDQAAATIRSLAITGAFTIPLNGLLTIAAGGSSGTLADVGSILKVGGGTATISGTGISSDLNRELIIRTDAAADTLVISAPLSAATGALTKSGDGRLILSNGANAFTGTTYVNGGKLTIQGPGALGTTTAPIVLAGGTYELLSDTDVATSKNVTVTGTGGVAFGRVSAGVSSLLTLGTLTIGNQVFTADPISGYAIRFAGTTTFTDALPATFNVTGTQASGTARALTLAGAVASGGFPVGLIKRGTGTLELGNGGNTFGGAGAMIELQQGVLSIAANGALGDPANSILLNAVETTAGLLATASMTTPRNVALGQATNTIEVVSGAILRLDGLVTSNLAADLVKRGAGKLVLANPGNTFGGTGSVIDVQGGILGSATSEALGGAANTVRLDGGSFSATGTFLAPQIFRLAQATNTIGVSQGNTLTLGAAFALPVATNGLVKSDLGTLVLTVAQPAWTGAIMIDAGAIRVSGSVANLLGATSAGTTIKTTGGLELTGGVVVAEPLTLNTPGTALTPVSTLAGSNLGGVLRTVVAPGVNSYTGAITVNAAVNDNTTRNIVFGADAGTTFSLTSSSSIHFNNGGAGAGRVANLILSGESSNANTLASAITKTGGALYLVKTGSGSWILAPTVVPAIDGMVVRSGTLQASAGFSTPGPPPTASLTFTGSSTFRHDNTTSISPAGRSLGTLTFSAGDGIVRNERSVNINSPLTFSSLTARQPGATGLFWVNGNTATFAGNAKIAFTAGATANTFLGAGYFAQANATTTGFAWYDAANFVRTIAYPGDNGATITAGNLTAAKHMQTTGAGAVALAASTGILSLNMAGSNVLTVAAGQILTIDSGAGAGGILKTGAVAGSIVGAGTVTAGGVGNELVVRTDLSTDSLTISIPITNTGIVTKSGMGTLTLSGTQGWAGKTAINGGTLLLQGTGALGGNATVALNGGTFSFQADGNGTGRQETIAISKDVTLDGANSGITVSKQAAAQALNKTISFGNLSLGSQALLVTGNNGFGARFDGTTSFTEALPSTINVAGSQASNVVQGLALVGVVSSVSGVGLIKTGSGTLVLENAGNTFGGVGGIIDIQNGDLAAGSDGALGNAGNNVTLNGFSVIDGFRAIGTFSTNRIFSLNQSINQFEVTQGNLLTLNASLNFDGATPAANSLHKNGLGVLELGGDSVATWAGAITINAGAIRLKTAAGLGNTTHVAGQPVVTITDPGAALQLSGTGTSYHAYPIRLSNGGIDTGGALENVSGDNLWTGAISLSADSTVIGSSSGTLRISGGIASSDATVRSLVLAGAGNLSLITTPLAGTIGTVTKIGSGTATLGVGSTGWTGKLVVDAGVFFLTGAETKIGGTGTIALTPGGRLVVDDSGTPVANRLSSRAITFTGGSLDLIGSSNGSTSETLTPGPAVFSRGLSTITITAGTGRQAVLAFNAAINDVAPTQFTVTGPTAASVLFRGTNLGNALAANVAQVISSTGGFTFDGQTGTPNTPAKGILPWALVDTDTANGVGTSFATADSATAGLRALRSTEMRTTLAAYSNLNLSAPRALNGTMIFNSATLQNAGGLAMVGLQQVILLSGGILALPGNAGISGGSLSAPATNPPLNIWTPGAATSLAISSSLTGGNGATVAGLIKAGAGLLILSGPQSGAFPGFSANSFNCMTVVNQGTLRLASGGNTLFPNNQVELGPGATLDLAGNSQWVQALFTDGAVAGAGGVVTSSTGAGTLVANYDNTARNWAGSIQGPVAFSRSGQNTATFYSDQNYSGVTQINGGTTILRDDAALSGTSAVDISFATLLLNNGSTGTMDSPDRVKDSAPVILRGAGLTLAGRPQTETRETMGDLTVAAGLSTILADASSGLAATGIFSADLTFGDGVGASLTREAGGVVYFAGQTNAAPRPLGLIGNGPRILFTIAPALSNNLIGPWAIVTGPSFAPEFASYVPTLGVGPLSGAGFAPYDGTALPGLDQPTQNIRLTTTGTLPAGGLTIHTLNLVGAGIGAFPSDTTMLTIAGGGLIHSGTSASIGTSPVDTRGQLTAGTTAAPTELVIYNGANTLTINSKIVDNAATGRVSLVISGSGTVALAAKSDNTYSGGTTVNNGVTVNTASAAAGAVVFPAGGLTINAATVTTTQSGQVAPTNVVTLNGSATLNLVGNNTLAGLAFNNAGGTSNPTLSTGGVLALPASSSVTATSSNVATTSQITGRLLLPDAVSIPFAVDAVMFNGVSVAPTLASLGISAIGSGTGGITKTGSGILQLNALMLFSGQLDVQAGGIQFGSAGGGGARFANLNLRTGAWVNLLTGPGFVGSLSGEAGSVITNSSTSSQTLTVGFDGTDTAFAGRFARFGNGIPNTANITKIGTGTLTLSGADSSSTAIFSLQGGTVKYAGAARTTFGTNRVLAGAALTLDNAAANTNNRLGGQGENPIALSISGGTVNIIGNGAADTLETIDTFTVGSGAGLLDLQANADRKLAIKVTSTLTEAQPGGTLLIKKLQTPNDPAYVPANGQPTIELVTGVSLNNPYGNIRPDIVASFDGGPATAFVTKDSVTNLLRLLTPATSTSYPPEVSGTLRSGARLPTHYDLTSVATIRENTSGSSLVLRDGAAILGEAPAPLGRYGPNGTLLTQTVESGGILAVEGGISAINVGLLSVRPAFAPSYDASLIFHAYGDLAITADVAAGTSGVTKSGGGTLTLTGRGFYTGATTVNAGNFMLDGSQENSIAVVPGATNALASALTVNGGVIDLKGHSQAFGALSSDNPNAGIGGVVTNSSGTKVTLTSSSLSLNSTFSGQITGNLNFAKTGNGTLTLTSANTYTGTTTIRGGGISLRDVGALSGTTAVEVHFGALTIDHSRLTPSGNLSPTRVNAPISLFGGTLSLLAGSAEGYTATITHPVTLAGGASTIAGQIPVSSGSSATLTLDSLVRTAATATVNFTAANAILGSTGFNVRTIFNTPPVLSNGIIGPWATVAGTDFAKYDPTNGIVALGTYTLTTLATGGVATNNVSSSFGATIGDTVLNVLRTTSAQTLIFTSAASTLTFGDSATMTSGGLLLNGATTIGAGTPTTNGALTSGGSHLFAYVNWASTINSAIKDGVNGPLTFIKSGTSTLTLTGASTYTGGTVVHQGTLTLANPSANGLSSVAVPGDLSLNNASASLSLPYQLLTSASVTIDGGGSLSMTSGQTNTIGRVTFNNRGGNTAPTVTTSTKLTLAAGGTSIAGAAAGSTIASTNEMLSTSPTISGTSLTLSNSQPIISTAGSSPNALLITAPIHSTGGVISKTGTGSVAFNPAISLTAFVNPSSEILLGLASTAGLAVGMSVTGPNITPGSVIADIITDTSLQLSLPTGPFAFATHTITIAGSTYTSGFTVNEGTLILGASSASDPFAFNRVQNGPVGRGTLTLADGAAIMSDGTIQTLHNPVSVQGNFTFGPPPGSTATALAGNGVILAGPMTFSPGTHSIAVNGPLNISTISGPIEWSNLALRKTGNGTLVLTDSGENGLWADGLAVDGGVLRNGANGGIPDRVNLSVAAGAIFDLSGINQILRTLSGGGAVTNSSTSPAILSVGGDKLFEIADSNFSGSIADVVGDGNAPIPASLGLTVIGAGTLTLGGPNSYRGETNVNSGTLRVSISGSLKIANDVIVRSFATAEINGLVTADAGKVRISAANARLRGSGTIAAGTDIAAGGILEPVGSGASTLTFQGTSILTLADTATLLYTASSTNANRVTLTGALADVRLPAGSGWELELQNPENVAPHGMTFVLFDGDDLGHRLNLNNNPGDDRVGLPMIDWGTTGWSLDPAYTSPYGSSGAGVHYDPATNNIVLVGVVPEPGTGSMLLGTFAVAVGFQRFRRRKIR